MNIDDILSPTPAYSGWGKKFKELPIQHPIIKSNTPQSSSSDSFSSSEPEKDI